MEVVFKPRSGLQSQKDRQLEHEIRGILEGVIPLGMHPRTSIMVVVQVLQEDGSLLSCALNAACAAMVDAGVPMSSMFGSVTCALAAAGGGLLLDPDGLEEQASKAVFSFTFPHHFDLAAGSEQAQPLVAAGALGTHCWGLFSAAELFDALELCRLGCERVATFSRLSLTKSLQGAAA